jgi:DNA topoisomerase-1
MAKSAANTALVIVESPTKAKTIRKFLPKEFVVEASMGHVRDLPQSAADIPKKYKEFEWSKIGVNVEEGFQPLYVVPKGKTKIINELKRKLKNAHTLYLATDEDREGESISFHLLELLKPKVPVKRMVFHEITKSAIQNALEDVREVDERLVRAQEARRILDRLVGYTLSPLIWKKIAYGLSAGRVQSAGLRLICDREMERIRFVKAEYWDLAAKLDKGGKEFDSKILSLDEVRIAGSKDFDEHTGQLKPDKKVKHLLGPDAQALAKELQNEEWKVTSVEEKQSTSRPSPPFITSTLQQESNRKLGLSSRDTMRIAQRLYEEGLITYMRTDSPNLSKQAIDGAREAIEGLYGKDYLSPEPRQYKSKGKAQEAHEAIRPAGQEFKHPKETGLSGKELALYELIWKRTVATQMADAKKNSVSVRIQAGKATFSASGTRIVFPGFLRAYVEGKDDPDAALEDREVLLPELKKGAVVKAKEVNALPHETKPPARFTEASIVQTLEKEGVGRPSTYASIISTILDRGYVRKVGNALVPTFTGMAVIQLLAKNFEELVDLGFTSKMEEALDNIAEGDLETVPYLSKFYSGKTGLLAKVEAKEKKIKADESRQIILPEIAKNDVELRIGRYGAYLVRPKSKKKDEVHCSIPEDVAPADLTSEMVEELLEASERGPEPIGTHPDTGENIYVLTGRYGPYVQQGEVTEENPKPRRSSVTKEFNWRDLSLDDALLLLSLPREVGKHPETGKEILANRGRFGPYVVHDGDFRSLKKEDDVYTVSLERALELLAQEKKGRRGAKLVKELGNHPKDEKPVGIYDGKYGMYVKHKSTNATLPKEADPEKYTLDEAVKLLDERRAQKKR